MLHNIRDTPVEVIGFVELVDRPGEVAWLGVDVHRQLGAEEPVLARGADDQEQHGKVVAGDGSGPSPDVFIPLERNEKQLGAAEAGNSRWLLQQLGCLDEHPREDVIHFPLGQVRSDFPEGSGDFYVRVPHYESPERPHHPSLGKDATKTRLTATGMAIDGQLYECLLVSC